MGAPRLRETGAGISVCRPTLQATAAMARCDPAKMSAPRVVDAFTKFVGLENDLLALLGQSIERDQTILATMTGRAA